MRDCPRCHSEQTRVMVKAPFDDAWELFVCDVCSYSWRSTENPKVLDIFQLKPEKIEELGVIPPVPPLDPDVQL